MHVARIMLHKWEEPVLVGEKGAGAIFFSGCNLRCVYCQNREISRAPEYGRTLSPQELAEAMLQLQADGAACIDLVTPTPWTHRIAEALADVRDRLTVPVVWNCGGYESVAALKQLDGLVDVYMPDFKYSDATLAVSLSEAANYAETAERALAEMFRQTGAYVLRDGILRRGVLIRHLILPGFRKDSLAVLSRIARAVPPDAVLLSLLRQYTPAFAEDAAEKSLHRSLTQFEYESVLAHAQSLGFDGFMQGKEAVGEQYTPQF